MFGISCELSARQAIHMKCQALFSLEKKCILCAAFLLGALNVKQVCISALSFQEVNKMLIVRKPYLEYCNTNRIITG